MIRTVLSLLLVLGAICSTFAAKNREYIPKEGKRIPQTLSRGWGDQLKWVQTYEEALFLSRTQTKPLLVIFHLEQCKFSQAMKKEFANHNEIQKILDEGFIVINLTYETTDKHLSPDGFYYPRFMFVDPSMTVRADITGPYSNHLYTCEPKDLPVYKEGFLAHTFTCFDGRRKSSVETCKVFANIKKAAMLLKPEL